MKRPAKLPAQQALAARIEREMMRLLDARAGKSICPSDVARALEPEDFRPLMPAVRDVAAVLRASGKVVVTQRGTPVDPLTAKGAIRISYAERAPVAKAAKAPSARTPKSASKAPSARTAKSASIAQSGRTAKSPSTRTSKSTQASEYHGIDFRKHPERYRIGRGEQGVLSAEPYKSELLPLWRFRTPELARTSARALREAFMRYRSERDFVGMDLTRKFLQMGFTRARRYANHASGRKYDAAGRPLPRVENAEKAAAAEIFKAEWDRIERDRVYASLRKGWSSDPRRNSPQ